MLFAIVLEADVFSNYSQAAVGDDEVAEREWQLHYVGAHHIDIAEGLKELAGPVLEQQSLFLELNARLGYELMEVLALNVFCEVKEAMGVAVGILSEEASEMRRQQKFLAGTEGQQLGVEHIEVLAPP